MTTTDPTATTDTTTTGTPSEGTSAPPAGPETMRDPEHQEVSANREAAKYRTRLREAETERDGIAERLKTMQRREVERLAGASLSRASDVWLDSADVAELLDDD